MHLVKTCSRICCAFTEATSHQATVSEELTSILEALSGENIPATWNAFGIDREDQDYHACGLQFKK